MSERLETIKVKRADGRGSHLINKSDFDPAVHEAVGEPQPAPAMPHDPREAPAAAENMTDEQLREAIKEATGKAPGPRSKRETLIKRLNERLDELNAQGAA